MEDKEITMYCDTIKVTTNYGIITLKNVSFVRFWNISDYENAMLKIFINERIRPIIIYYKDVVLISID